MKIYIGTPTADKICSRTVGDILVLDRLLNHLGHETVIDLTISNTIIFIRNTMASKAVALGCDYLVFIDSDISFNPADIVRLIQSGRDVTAIAYRKKKDREEYCCLIESGEDGRPVVDDNGWVELFAAATGILCVKREVIEKMSEAYSGRAYTTDDGQKRVALFEYELIDGKYWGEDYNFSRRWKDMGGKIWLLPNADTGHTGIQEFVGNIHHYLMKSSETTNYKGNTIQGWMNEIELEWLFNKASDMGSVVEIGSWKGRSTHALCSGCKGTVHAIDHFKGTPEDGHAVYTEDENIFEAFKRNVGKFKNLRIYPVSSHQASGEIESVDMAFIDGDHSYEAVKNDILTWLPKTKRLICGHDYNQQRIGLRRAVDEIFGDDVNVVDSIWYVEGKTDD